MQRDHVAVAFSIVRNSAALMTVGLLAKGMGLVIAVLIARFLGPDGMGLFALLFSIALLVESITPLGLQDVLVRDVAARPQERTAYWKLASRLGVVASLVPSAAFLVAAWVYRDQDSLRNSLTALAVGIPCSAVALVGQAVLQGLERVLYLTWTTFVTRVVSLVALVVMLMQGFGVEAAFISRALFQASSAALFAFKILRRPPAGAAKARLEFGFARTLPFAVNRVLMELTTRAPLLLLPLMFTFAQIGLFDAADRVRLTLGIMVSLAATAIMPVFARSVAEGAGARDLLVGFSVKYVCLAISLAALGISIFAEFLVALLYGQAFAESARLLQVLVWAQVLIATDSVLKQAMIAHGREYAVVARASIGVACLALLVVALGHVFGLVGAAAAVVIAVAVTLVMDLGFVTRSVLPIDARAYVLKPLACAAAAGIVLLLLDGETLAVRLGAGLLTFSAVALATGILPRSERRFLREAVRHGLGRRLPVESGRQ